MRRTGFTLIELLVVIAIVAILAAILFPVFSRAQSKAMQAACINNLKQIGTATLMYCHDWDMTTPPRVACDRTASIAVPWSPPPTTLPAAPPGGAQAAWGASRLAVAVPTERGGAVLPRLREQQTLL